MPLFGKKKKDGEEGGGPKKEKKKKEKKPKKEKPPKEKKPKKEKPKKEKKPKPPKPPKKEKKKKGKDAPPPEPGAEGEEEGKKKGGFPKIVLLIVPVFVLAGVGAFLFLRLRGGASKYPDGSTLVSEQVLVLSEGTVIFSSDGSFIVPVEADDEAGSDGEAPDGQVPGDGGGVEEDGPRLSPSAFVIAEGAVVESDGSVILPDGLLEIGSDGEVFLPDGTTVLSDGTVIEPPPPEPMDPQDTPERVSRDPGMTMGQVVSYFRNLDPRILELDAQSMDEYDIFPVEGSIKVDGQPCAQVQIYERGASGYNAVRGVFLVTRSGSRHVYRYDPASRSVTEVDLTPIDQRPDPITLEPAYQAGYQAGYEAGLAAARAEARREAELAEMEGAEGDG